LENAASKHGTKQKLITRVCPEYVVSTSGKALQASLHDRSPVMEAASRRTCKGIANSMSKEQTASQCRNCLSLARVLLPPSQRRFSRVPADAAYATSKAAAAQTRIGKEGSIILIPSVYRTVNL
jgi:hypothetical protein